MTLWMNDVTNLIFPKVCPGCNKPLVLGEQEICMHCTSQLPDRLSLRVENLEQRFYGRIAIHEAHGYLFFKRKGLTQKLLHSIKYNGNTELAKELGRLFGYRCKDLGLYSSVDVIIPVPLHKSKQRLRGYNQSELIATGLSEVLQKPLDPKGVLRVAKTATQTKKTRSERWKNVNQIFQVKDNALTGKHVLIIDDVVTTGATLESCAQSVLDSGADKISIGCLAVA